MQARPLSSCGVCLSVCLSACLSRSSILSKRINISSFVSPSGSQTILVNTYQTAWHGNIPTGSPITGAKDAGGVGRNRDSEPMASLRAVNAATRQVLSIRRRQTTVPQVVRHLSLVISGGVDSRKRRKHVYDKKPQRYAKDNRTAHLIARSDKYVAYVTNNKCIGDDTKAAARQRPNCIKNQKNIKYGEKRLSIWRMELLHPAMWHDHDIDFARWLHPALWHVALESWQWIHQVATPCDVIRGSEMTYDRIPPNVRHIGILHLVSILTISPQSTCHSAPVYKILSKSDQPQQKNDVMSIFKMADLSHLGF